MSAVALSALAACSGDMPSAPVAPSLDVAAPSFARGGNGKAENANKNGERADKSLVLTIKVDPTRTETHRLGGHWVHIPANVICSQDSGYALELWDTPCASLASAPFDLDVEIVEVDGRPSVRFLTDLRFAPSSSMRDWVILGLRIKGNLDAQLGYGILFQPTGSSEWIDESLTDPSLRAFRSKGNTIARRLKHFSGYNVSLGFQEQQDPTGGEVGGAY